MSEAAFKRVLLKLSGESLMGSLEYGTDPERVRVIAEHVKSIRDRGVEVAIVVGAGNIYRGMKGAAAGMDRATADYMGMLATVLNALPLQDALEKLDVYTRVVSALTIAEGKLRKWMEEVVLLNQPHINGDKYDGKTIEQIRAELAGQTGENVVIRRFSKFQVGA